MGTQNINIYRYNIFCRARINTSFTEVFNRAKTLNCHLGHTHIFIINRRFSIELEGINFHHLQKFNRARINNFIIHISFQ